MQFKELAARNAFWGMTRVSFSRLAEVWGINVNECTDLCSTLTTMVAEILKTDEGAVIEVLSKRLAVNDISAVYMPSLLEVDDAVQVLEHHDQREFHERQKK